MTNDYSRPILHAVRLRNTRFDDLPEWIYFVTCDDRAWWEVTKDEAPKLGATLIDPHAKAKGEGSGTFPISYAKRGLYYFGEEIENLF